MATDELVPNRLTDISPKAYEHPADRAAPAPRRAAAAGGPRGAARVVPRGGAQLRSRRDPGESRSTDHLPDAHGSRGRARVEEAQPRRLPAAGGRLRGLGARPRPDPPLLPRAAAHAPLPGPARRGDP